MTVTYQSKTLFTKFHVNDKTNYCQKNNLVYHGKCAYENCRDDYTGETDRKIKNSLLIIIKAIITHTSLDTHVKCNNITLAQQDLKIITGSNYRSKEKLVKGYLLNILN